MLSKVNVALQAAADIVAPPCKNIDDLSFYWRQIVNVCHQALHGISQNNPAIEETNVVMYLSNINKSLLDDENNVEKIGILSPCMEFVIQERMFLSLASYAWADRPLGIRQEILRFFTDIINKLSSCHFHHSRICKPLLTMICIINETKASPYEREEMAFLAAFVEEIRKDKSQVMLYIQRSVHSDYSSSNVPSSFMEESELHYKVSSECPLMDALVHLCHSADVKIMNAAHECVLSLAGIKHNQCSEAITQQSLLPHYITDRLLNAIRDIPLDVEPIFIESIGDDKSNSGSINEYEEPVIVNFPGRQEVENVFQWMMFCDELVQCSDSILGSCICDTLRENVLEGCLKAYLNNEDTEVISVFIALITKLIRDLSSPLLVDCFVTWLVEDLEEPDSGLRLMLHLCHSSSHQIKLQTLRLFQILLMKPGDVAVQTLILNYLTGRSYFDSSTTEQQQSSWSDEEDERCKMTIGSHDLLPDSKVISNTLAPPSINRIVKRFLSLVPLELRSTSLDDFDSYKSDAQRQYESIYKSSISCGWPKEAVPNEGFSESSSTVSRESQPEVDSSSFYEGPFLKMLLDYLEQLQNQDYDINLQVTSLVSSLALLPHPHLHEFLLNCCMPFAEGIRTPYTILSRVVSCIEPFITSKEEFHTHLRLTKFRLLGTIEDVSFEDHDDDERKFECLIVIEEFSKELAAIALAKYNMERS